MPEFEVPEEFSLPQRRQLVERARANLRARGVEQSPRAAALYDLYVAGTYTRAQIQAILAQERQGTMPLAPE
jgi:hypothetical protein